MILVSGNRSGDLDSLVSSYVKSEILRLSHKNEEIILLCYFDESQWKLHRDAHLLLAECGAESSRFQSVTDLGIQALPDDLKLYITDHNHLEKELSHLSSFLVEISDHHKVMFPIKDRVKQMIHNTGSCSTIIAKELLKLVENRKIEVPKDLVIRLAEMLYFTIKKDTEYLTDNGQYDLDEDRRILSKLKPYVKKEDNYLMKLKAAKDDTSSFTLLDHLSSDYKFWELSSLSYGMSTIHTESKGFLPQFVNEKDSLIPFMKNEKIDILFLMHFLKEPILKRELTVIPSKSCNIREDLIQRLNHTEQFVSNGHEYFGDLMIYKYDQKDPDLSRKKIQPLLNGILEKLL